MNKYTLTAVIVTLLYVVPLLGSPELLINHKILMLMAVCSILLLTQPPLSFKEAEERREMDKYSIFMILIASTLSQVVAVVEWAYFQDHATAPENSILTEIGIILLLSGMVFRIWSIQTLGRFFTATVQVNDNQEIIKTGPYAIICHPSYLGAYITVVGSTVFLQTIIGFILALFLMFYAYKVRVSAEEEALVKAFGDNYRNYQKLTNKMIPYVW